VLARDRWDLRHVELAAPTWYGHLLWVAAAAVLGFAVSEVFSSLLEVPRDWLLLAYVALLAPFLAGYVWWSRLDVGQLVRRHWRLGLAGATVAGVVMAVGVQRMDASPRATGGELLFDLLWLGVVYGVADALLLNVLPVVGVWQASTLLGRTVTWTGKIVTGAAALVASLVVTAAYHLGYAEYRGSELAEPLFGNMLMTLSYLVFANPIVAVVAHVALHVASVIHGVDSTVTLPPHY
jgi:hypothetical protein